MTGGPRESVAPIRSKSMKALLTIAALLLAATGFAQTQSEIGDRDWWPVVRALEKGTGANTTLTVFGRNGDIDTGSDPEDVWGGGGLYTGHSTLAADTVKIVSSSAVDSAGGAGCREVTIYGLASLDAREETSEAIALDGTDTVLSSGTWYRIYRAECSSNGTSASGPNVGTISVRSQDNWATVFATISPGAGKSHQAVFTVPKGKRAFIWPRIRTAHASGGGGAGSLTQISVRVKSAAAGGVGVAERWYTVTSGEDNPAPVYFPVVVEEQQDVVVRVEVVSHNDTFVDAELSILVVR